MATLIIHSGILTSFGTLKDGTVKFTINCQEMSKSVAAELISLNNQYIKFAISDDNIDKVNIDKLINIHATDVKHKKTPSQRLRNVLYVLWEKSNSELDFDTFYEQNMENLIRFVKLKLED